MKEQYIISEEYIEKKNKDLINNSDFPKNQLDDISKCIFGLESEIIGTKEENPHNHL